MALKEVTPRPVRLSRGAAVSLAFLVAVGGGVIAMNAGRPDLRPDVDQLWFASRVLLEGGNPYESVGPGLDFDYPWRLYYPLPAVLLLTPLSQFPLAVARVFIAAVGGALLAYGVARHEARGLVVFLSYAFYANAWYAQWTPLLVAMWYFPLLAALTAAKPTIGLLMLTGVREWRGALRGLALAAALTVTSVFLRPNWIQDWLAALDSNTHLRAWVTVPGGVLVLLAFLRWRRWEAWMLALFVLVPQTFHPLATLPLVLLPGTLLGKATIAALTYVPNWLLVRDPFGPRLASATPEELIGMYGVLVLWSVLVPTLFVVLRLPNSGPAPAWIERRIVRWPLWLRGNP
jgi:hypothetical protein